MRAGATTFLVGLLLAATAAIAAPRNEPEAPLGMHLAAIPARVADAPTGTAFVHRTEGWPESERQRAALDALEQGDVPSFLRQFKPVVLHGRTARGATVTATVWVAPDYLAIGSDTDFLYIPLAWPSATEVAQRFGCVLPTPRIVDAIYEQAAVHLAPQPLPAGPEMRSNAYCARHQALIDAQRAGVPLGALIAGHKKDIVLSERLLLHPDRIAIYGWHRLDGRPIQPLSTVHGVRYADYSHGVRLVWHEVGIDGVPREITEVLADRDLAPLLSNEGPLHSPRDLLDPVRASVAAGSAPGGSPELRRAQP